MRRCAAATIHAGLLLCVTLTACTDPTLPVLSIEPPNSDVGGLLDARLDARADASVDAAVDAQVDAEGDARVELDAQIDECPPRCPHTQVCRDNRCVSLCEAAALDGAPVGCGFAVAPIGRFYFESPVDPRFLLHLANPSVDAEAEVEIFGPGARLDVRVPAGGMTTTVLALNAQPGGGRLNRVWRVNSTLPVAAWHSQAQATPTNDAVRLLPDHQLGLDYVVLSRAEDVGPSVFTVANPTIVDDVEVNIHLAAATRAAPGLEALEAGASTRLILAPGEAVTFATGAVGDDLTGSRIRSADPVAVFAGSEATDVPALACVEGRCNADPAMECATRQDCVDAGVDICCADNLEEQMRPTNLLGTRHLAIPTAPEQVEDYWRVVAISDATEVISVPPQHAPVILDADGWFEFTSAETFEVRSTAPVAVAQFMPSAPPTAPTMIHLVPTAGFSRVHHFGTVDLVADDEDTRNQMTVMGPADAQVEIDGRVIELDEAVGAWRYGRFEIGRGAHTVRSTQPVGVLIFALGRNTDSSYGTTTGVSRFDNE